VVATALISHSPKHLLFSVCAATRWCSKRQHAPHVRIWQAHCVAASSCCILAPAACICLADAPPHTLQDGATLAQQVKATRKELDSASRQLTVLTGELAVAKVSEKESQERHKAVSSSELVARSGRFQWHLCYV
jgi:hypothetical protein